MNEDQKFAIDSASNGHSFLLHGQAGTGKTSACHHIIKTLKEEKKNVIVCCATGIACSPLHEFSAQTLHRTFGLKDGRYNNDQLKILYADSCDRYYAERKERIVHADVLIVDEISMISKHILGMVDSICQYVRGNDKPLGGLQAIFIGDFFQLPPVPNVAFGDRGEFCFKYPSFYAMVPHKIKLMQVVRQDEQLLISAIQELSNGKLSDTAQAYIKSLSRPLDIPDVKKHALFSENASSRIYNMKMLNSLPGDLHTYDAKDEGDLAHLAKLQAEKVLSLKVGARVMLIKNMTDVMVNGMQGNVTALHQDSATVKLDCFDHGIKFKAELFTKYDPSSSKDVAKRWQLPLQLSFGTTIHKAQGLTLDNVVVDCSGIFAPGQLSVALGRAKKSCGLQIMKFLPSRHIIPPRNEVVTFDQTPGDPITKECCLKDRHSDYEHSENVENDASQINVSDKDSSMDEADDDKEILSILKELLDESNQASSDIYSQADSDAEDSESSECDANAAESPIPYKIRIAAIFNVKSYFQTELSCLSDTSDLDVEKSSCYKHFMQLPSVQELADTAALALGNHWQTCKKNSQGQSLFFSYYHTYSLEAYPKLIAETVGNVSATGYQVLISLLKAIRQKIMIHSPALKKDSSESKVVSEASKGKIRYLAGRCVAKCRKNTQQYILTNGAKKKKEKQCSTMHKKLDHLNHMRTSYESLSKSSFISTLHETERRQNVSRGLTHVSDETFGFYVALEEERLKLHNLEHVKESGGQILADSIVKLLNSEQLKQLFADIFKDMEESSEQCITLLFEQLVESYMSIANNEFRKCLCRTLQKKRKLRHRVEILRTGKTGDKKSVKQKDGRKKQNVSSEENIEETIEVETEKSDEMPNRGMDENSEPSTSQHEDNSGNVSTGSKNKDVTDISAEEMDAEKLCPLCKSHDKRLKLWIECNSCNHWIHRRCAGLTNAKLWAKFQKKDVVWLCSKCDSS